MEEIKLKVELLFTLNSKKDWINKVPRILPKKNRGNESFLWVDKNGCVLEYGADFMAAEELDSYPCKVYRTITVSQFLNDYKQNNKKTEN